MAWDYKNSIRNEQQEVVKMLNKKEGVNIKIWRTQKSPTISSQAFRIMVARGRPICREQIGILQLAAMTVRQTTGM